MFQFVFRSVFLFFDGWFKNILFRPLSSPNDGSFKLHPFLWTNPVPLQSPVLMPTVTKKREPQTSKRSTKYWKGKSKIRVHHGYCQLAEGGLQNDNFKRWLVKNIPRPAEPALWDVSVLLRRRLKMLMLRRWIYCAGDWPPDTRLVLWVTNMGRRSWITRRTSRVQRPVKHLHVSSLSQGKKKETPCTEGPLNLFLLPTGDRSWQL